MNKRARPAFFLLLHNFSGNCYSKKTHKLASAQNGGAYHLHYNMGEIKIEAGASARSLSRSAKLRNGNPAVWEKNNAANIMQILAQILQRNQKE